MAGAPGGTVAEGGRGTRRGAAAAAHIGTSGWAYPGWRGIFYPRDLRQGEWLGHYARFFDTVEVNASFYRLPTEKLIAAWCARTPEGFRFAVKAWRAITHYRRLAACEDLLADFFDRIAHFGDRLGPVLFQLPPRFPADPGRLARFLERLPKGHRYAFEFRDPSWHREAVYGLLRKAGAAFCPFDLAGLLGPRVVTADFVYVRLHGHERRYRGAYDEALLADWARWLRQRREEGREVWFYFDNTDEAAHAVFDAMRLRRLLGQSAPATAAPLTNP